MAKGSGMKPLDLTKGRPRPPLAELDGIMFFARTIDKARATLPGGNIGDYSYVPSMSEMFLKHFGVDPDAFVEAVKKADSDADVATWFRSQIDASKIPSWNETASTRPVTDENRDRIAVRHPIAKRDRSLVRVADLLLADDRESLGEKLAIDV